jgi:hypothetical protein
VAPSLSGDLQSVCPLSCDLSRDENGRGQDDLGRKEHFSTCYAVFLGFSMERRFSMQFILNLPYLGKISILWENRVRFFPFSLE